MAKLGKRKEQQAAPGSTQADERTNCSNPGVSRTQLSLSKDLPTHSTSSLPTYLYTNLPTNYPPNTNQKSMPGETRAEEWITCFTRRPYKVSAL